MRVHNPDLQMRVSNKRGEIEMRLLKKGPIFCVCGYSGKIIGNIVYDNPEIDRWSIKYLMPALYLVSEHQG
jgi:hypothetical protein